MTSCFIILSTHIYLLQAIWTGAKWTVPCRSKGTLKNVDCLSSSCEVSHFLDDRRHPSCGCCVLSCARVLVPTWVADPRGCCECHLLSLRNTSPSQQIQEAANTVYSALPLCSSVSHFFEKHLSAQHTVPAFLFPGLTLPSAVMLVSSILRLQLSRQCLQSRAFS